MNFSNAFRLDALLVLGGVGCVLIMVVGPPQTCQDTCADYPYFGLQYGSECWCGDYKTDYDKHGTSTRCTMECSGDPDSTCGGYDALYVYTQGGAPRDEEV